MNKKLNRLITILALSGVLCGGASLVMSGCSSWQSTTHKSVGTVAISGDAAMKAWAAYVHSGKATAEGEAKVKRAYERYQASMNAIIDVGKSATTSTNKATIEIIAASAVAAQENLIKTIEAFTRK
jgi:hypothetical protein